MLNQAVVSYPSSATSYFFSWAWTSTEQPPLLFPPLSKISFACSYEVQTIFDYRTGRRSCKSSTRSVRRKKRILGMNMSLRWFLSHRVSRLWLCISSSFFLSHSTPPPLTYNRVVAVLTSLSLSHTLRHPNWDSHPGRITSQRASSCSLPTIWIPRILRSSRLSPIRWRRPRRYSWSRTRTRTRSSGRRSEGARAASRPRPRPEFRGRLDGGR